MRAFFVFIIALFLVGGGLFFYNVKKENGGNGNAPAPEPSVISDIIEGWPDGVPISPALKEQAKEVKSLISLEGWQEYINPKDGYRLKYPNVDPAFFLKPYVAEEASSGFWYRMSDVFWSSIVHIHEPVRKDAEGLFKISVFVKEGAFEEAAQKVRETIVSGKTFLSERAVKVGELQGVRVAVVNQEETSYGIAYVLYRQTDPEPSSSTSYGAGAKQDPAPEQVRYGTSAKQTQNYRGKIFIIDIAIDRIEDPAETEEQFADRVSREQKYFDTVVSTFQMINESTRIYDE